jgi:hypothetical protein
MEHWFHYGGYTGAEMKWIIGITKSSLAYKLLVLLQGLQR